LATGANYAQAVELHKRGDLAGAELKYRRAASGDGGTEAAAEALHNLGVLLVELHGHGRVRAPC
jgi:hypothetical protein